MNFFTDKSLSNWRRKRGAQDGGVSPLNNSLVLVIGKFTNTQGKPSATAPNSSPPPLTPRQQEQLADLLARLA
ncbi:MAG TPA: hypothetical protein DCS87_11505 [Rheinheimera sp.]|nr:hypothetical protein [Rheinheimera sp.]